MGDIRDRPAHATPDSLQRVNSNAASAAFERLSVFYPMWNEEEYIERAIAYGRRACERLLASGDIGDYELIIIDDASTDDTPAIADRLAAIENWVARCGRASRRPLVTSCCIPMRICHST
jgi:glycosyltransferase involved in cell wall biosynthesis